MCEKASELGLPALSSEEKVEGESQAGLEAS